MCLPEHTARTDMAVASGMQSRPWRAAQAVEGAERGNEDHGRLSDDVSVG